MNKKEEYYPFQDRAEHDMINKVTVSLVKIHAEVNELVKTFDVYSNRAKKVRKEDEKPDNT